VSAPAVRRLDPVAIAGLMSREWTMYKRRWRTITFSAVVEPAVFLLAFGLGFGALVPRVAGLEYVEFVGTGVVATAVLFSSTFPGMYNTFIRWRFQRTYDALLAAPVDVEELVTAEIAWISLRSGLYCMAPLLVATAFGLDPAPGMLVVPLIGILTGFAFGGFGVLIAAVAGSIDNFSYITSAVLTPLFLVAGTFFPIDALPEWAATVAQLNPLYHCVELVRHAVFGFEGASDLVHLGVLLGFAALTWRLSIWRLGKRLID
jgi:lipooligosaccharide transport system permease protein